MLVRPVSPVLQVLTQAFGIQGFGTVLVGAAILVRAMRELHLAWGVGEWALLAATLLGGTVLLGAVNLATSSSAFWEPASTSALPFTVQNLAEFAKFPLTLYGRFVQVLLTWVLPFGLVTYYPSTVLLGRPDAHLWLGWLAPLAGPAMAVVAGVIWQCGLGRYQGAGH